MFLLALAAGAAAWCLLALPKTSVAVAFHISTQAPALLDATSESRIDFGSYRQAQIALVKRRQTLAAVLSSPAVQQLGVIQKQPNPQDWLSDALKVDTKGGELMVVSIEGDNPEELFTILEALCRAYLAEVDERDNGTRRRRIDKLEATNRSYRADLKTNYDRIDAIAVSLGAKDGETQALNDSLLRDDLRNATRELSVVRDQLQRAELDLRAAETPNAAPEAGGKGGAGTAPPGREAVVSPAQIDEELRQDADLRELEARVVQAQLTLNATKALFNPGERPLAVAKAEEELAAAQQKRDKYRDELRPRLESAVRKQAEQRERARMAGLRDAVAGLKKQEALVKTKVLDLREEVVKSNDYRVEIAKIRSEIAQTEKVMTRIADEANSIKIELGGAPPRVSLAEEPHVVPGLGGSRRKKFAVAAVLGVLFVGFAGVVLWEQRTARVTHPDDVTVALGVRLIGAVPPAGPAQDGTHAVLVEAIDATRTMLLSGGPDSDLRVVVVASAIAGEGKTSLSGHLAISLARAGSRTLLIDGDLRAPTAQRVFGGPLAPGLCEVLRGEIGAVAAVRPTDVPGLSVLTAGEWTLVTRQALVGNGWRAVKEQLRAAFDFVVVDTSPLLLVSDALLLAREADGVVVSVLMGVSQVALTEEAVSRLQTVRAKLTGVIANGVRSAAHEYTRAYRAHESPALPVGGAGGPHER
ncbi:hypothetical protein FTUN_5625 [Frigoriglobus tundricola]|uniref:CobQ/CobB/MinD/ParA nucleotide binding domain-containing protein n=1 Tax=Frigoriglobus tundricola TaxID=2774151 RepID=A0A6M5YVJ1_9BACT|nr:hypothetical protein FTUN_5625 [Frigoriglobus tundricola]